MKKSKIVKMFGITLAFTLAISSLAGCKKEKQEETTTQETTTKDLHLGQARSLLTGQWIDENLATKRPVAIMFNNIYEGCPQNGIEKASIIYEAPVEGGICRLMGLFEDYSGLERIGSIRSARTYFPMFANEYDALYMHHGQAYYALDALEHVDDLDCMGGYGGLLAYRTTDREAPHNSFTKPEMIDQGIAAYGYRTEYDTGMVSHFRMASDDETIELKDGATATVIEPGYYSNTPKFEYNEKDGLYYRWQYEEKHIDELTGNQLTCKNIIFQYCDYTMYEDSPYLNIDVTSGGKGMLFTNGKCEEITWQKEGDWGITHYFDSTGKEIKLNQGKTWVCVVLNDALDQISIR